MRLRDKLTLLLPALDLLEKGLSSENLTEETRERYLGEARRASLGIMRVTNNLRDLAKTFQDHAEPCPANLSDLFSQIISETKQMVAHKPTAISFDCAETPFIANVDAANVKRLLYNLMSNAVLYGGGEVTASLTRSGGSIRLRIQNNGNDLNEIDPNYPGLGLCLALSIARQNGGTMMITSHKITGTTVTISLPDEPLGDIPLEAPIGNLGDFPQHLIELSDIPVYNKAYNLRD